VVGALSSKGLVPATKGSIRGNPDPDDGSGSDAAVVVQVSVPGVIRWVSLEYGLLARAHQKSPPRLQLLN
jgi:hypothetical protein